MEQHRKNPACASCHRVIDPVGFALENFDAVGAWRTRDGGTLGSPVDASGELADGTRSAAWWSCGRRSLRRPETFVETLTEKLLTYAVGRGPRPRRTCRSCDWSCGARAPSDYRFSSLVLGIVSSAPFQMRIKASEALRAAQLHAEARSGRPEPELGLDP